MSNPTGTTYLAANLGYVWTDGDVYEIEQTDQVEGAATGASFAGLGVDNQPHQALLNKIQQLHNNQLADEATIALLQTLIITSTVGTNGWMQIGADDINLGLIRPILQWGTIPFSFPTLPIRIPDSWTINFPKAFTRACWILRPYFESQGVIAANQQNPVTLMPVRPLLTNNNVITWVSPNSEFSIVYSPVNSPVGVTGIAWLAFGL